MINTIEILFNYLTMSCLSGQDSPYFDKYMKENITLCPELYNKLGSSNQSLLGNSDRGTLNKKEKENLQKGRILKLLEQI